MSYRKTKTGAQLNMDLAGIRSLTNSIMTLRPGEAITVTDTQAAVTKIRYLVYEWLFQNGLKSHFRIRRESPGRLRIIRVIQLDPTVSIERHNGQDGLDQVQVFVRDNMLQLESDDEAIAFLGTKPDLSTEERLNILTEWRRIND